MLQKQEKLEIIENDINELNKKLLITDILVVGNIITLKQDNHSLQPLFFPFIQYKMNSKETYVFFVNIGVFCRAPSNRIQNEMIEMLDDYVKTNTLQDIKVDQAFKPRSLSSYRKLHTLIEKKIELKYSVIHRLNSAQELLKNMISFLNSINEDNKSEQINKKIKKQKKSLASSSKTIPTIFNIQSGKDISRVVNAMYDEFRHAQNKLYYDDGFYDIGYQINP